MHTQGKRGPEHMELLDGTCISDATHRKCNAYCQKEGTGGEFCDIATVSRTQQHGMETTDVKNFTVMLMMPHSTIVASVRLCVRHVRTEIHYR